MTIPIDSLLKLPPLATYSAKKGQANAKVSRDESNIIVYASCDSLQQLVSLYKMESANYKQRNDELKKESDELKQMVLESDSNFKKMLLYAFLAGLISGIISTIIFIKKKK